MHTVSGMDELPAEKSGPLTMERRAFLLCSAAFALAGCTNSSSAQGGVPGSAPRGGGTEAPLEKPHRFFQDPSLEYAVVAALGRAFYASGNIGKVLHVASQIEDGMPASAATAFRQAGDDANTIAEEAERHHHRESARQAYLWAAGYYGSSMRFLDAADQSARMLPTWEALDRCWQKSASLSDPVVDRVEIPYESTHLVGWLFRASGSGKRRPLVILNNGSEGTANEMWTQGGAAAVARGYHALAFDGPGQGHALWQQNLFFRPDWEKVVTPVVEWALKRDEIDPQRIAIQGVGQGGYWVSRAAAYEHRLAAVIADPGVVKVSSLWTSRLPKETVEMLRAGKKSDFDAAMEKGPSPVERGALVWRMRPYGMSSYYDVVRATQTYDLHGVAENIRCPILVTEAANEEFWPGQSRLLYGMVKKSPKQLVQFTAQDGANLHCEVNSLGLRDLRVFDWLDETLRIGV
jgi:poly(3-hydroxybutyrate) depolymerase